MFSISGKTLERLMKPTSTQEAFDKYFGALSVRKLRLDGSGVVDVGRTNDFLLKLVQEKYKPYVMWGGRPLFRHAFYDESGLLHISYRGEMPERWLHLAPPEIISKDYAIEYLNGDERLKAVAFKGHEVLLSEVNKLKCVS